MARISTHVLDTAQGQPAKDLPVRLERRDTSGNWRLLASARTDQDGRCAELVPEKEALTPWAILVWGFETATYFGSRNGSAGLYPMVEIAFPSSGRKSPFSYPSAIEPKWLYDLSRKLNRES